MSTSADSRITEAWGDYVPGHRIEIEPVDTSELSWSGRGPTLPEARQRPERWLTQRAVESPHPITWHSLPYESLDEACHAQYRLEGTVPYLQSAACDIHWSIFGCDGDKDANGETRSYSQCTTRACDEYARTLLKAIAENAAIVLELLEQTSS